MRAAFVMQEYAKTFYKSAAWKHTREAYMKSVGGLCERCKAKGLIVPGEIIHHKIYISPDNITDTSITLNWKNLECVCRFHHAEEHSGSIKRYKVDALGKIESIE